jgi:predicted amidophosphoribosyltransferase
MPLSGVNKLCASCKGKCKQWKQITVVYCPNFAKRQKVHLDQAQKS